MSKRKNKDPGRDRQLHPQQSFQQLVSDATLEKLAGYIDQEMQGLGQALLERQAQSQTAMFVRILAIEEILLETVPGLTKDAMAGRVATIQDRNDGFETADEVISGDRVRLEIKTKTCDQTEFQGASRLQLDAAGSGQTLGKEIEAALIGMKSGETKDIKFGKDGAMDARLTVHKVSRKPAPIAATEDPTQFVGGGETQEAPDASPDAR